MPRRTVTQPKYRHHRASGQAVVWINGRDIYLGPHGSDDSKAEYNRLVAALHLQRSAKEIPHVPPSQCTLDELFLAYWDHCQRHYRKNGEPSSEQAAVRSASRHLLELYGRESVDDFGPIKLKTVRQAMVEAGLARSTVNQHIMRLRRMIKWGVENELVRPDTLAALQAVAGLRQGRTDARETNPVTPADEAIVNRVLEVCSRQVAAMIRLQIAAGMRPGEVVMLRPCDIDCTGNVWIYEPATHKTEHHGRQRRIFLGPKAQETLRSFLADRSPFVFCFSPAEAEAERRATNHAKRATPLSCGNRPGTNRKRRPVKMPRERYDVGSYRRAIDYACRKAFPPPKGLKEEAKRAWIADHRFHPHQLRHNAATFIAKEYGIEAAQVVLGHASLAITQVYAERDYTKAAAIMAEVG